MSYQNEIHIGEDTSDDDYVTESDETDEDYDYEIDTELETLRKLIQSIDSSIETLETQMISIQRPIEGLHIDQLGDIPFLQTSPFRQTALKFKHDLPGGLTASKRYTFAEICETLRNYMYEHNMVQSDGTIHLTPAFMSLFGIKTPIVTYMGLLRHLHTVVY